MSREMDLMHIMILSLNALMEHESLLSKTSQFGRWEGWGPGVTGENIYTSVVRRGFSIFHLRGDAVTSKRS